MSLEIITRKLLSYCEIPEEITNESYLLAEASNDCYVEYEVLGKEEQKKFSDNFDLANWILSEYPECENEKILIHIDY